MLLLLLLWQQQQNAGGLRTFKTKSYEAQQFKPLKPNLV
jgi:hypothetical protein